MPTFDIVSQFDLQEVRNAVDQASREVSTRYDFRDTDSSVVLTDNTLTLSSSTEDRLTAVRQVLEEKLVRRKVSLKTLDYGKIQEAANASYRQIVTLRKGISADKAREINKFISKLKIKGLQSSTQGEQLRVQSKKRDSLQEVIAALKEADFDIPLQYVNFRD
ncbi:MAG: YajQ family cyclic di-GMP-binding protein [Acidimicrobiaceae bacterium]|nr:YajQ family cyclic di-GMP-binding protein [Acidimicrobiaceae bacterium]